MSYKHRVYRPDGSFWVSEWRDDATRTVTTYDETGTVLDTRPYTAEENAEADAQAAAEAVQQIADQLANDTAADLTKIEEAIATFRLLTAAVGVTGSIRQAVIGPAGAAAGTANLRAVKAKAAVDGNVTALRATVGALADLCIVLAQLVIDGAAASRKSDRQTLRLAKAAVGDFDSADVGAE